MTYPQQTFVLLCGFECLVLYAAADQAHSRAALLYKREEQQAWLWRYNADVRHQIARMYMSMTPPKHHNSALQYHGQ